MYGITTNLNNIILNTILFLITVITLPLYGGKCSESSSFQKCNRPLCFGQRTQKITF